MSKFFDVINILNEYDVRHSSQGIPSVPGDGYTSTSDPSIAGNAAQTGSFKRKFDPAIKPFADEANHHDNGKILPYPLDHSVFDRLVNIEVAAKELISLINISLASNEFTKPQQEMLSTHKQLFEQQIKHIENFAKDLDILSIQD